MSYGPPVGGLSASVNHGVITGRDFEGPLLLVRMLEGGIDTTCYIECRSCGATNDPDMPFSLEFFRPDAARDA